LSAILSQYFLLIVGAGQHETKVLLRMQRFLLSSPFTSRSFHEIPENPRSRGALNSRLASVDSGLQVNLEIALSGVSAKVKPPNRAFQLDSEPIGV
jgi:hypothetical protein